LIKRDLTALGLSLVLVLGSAFAVFNLGQPSPLVFADQGNGKGNSGVNNINNSQDKGNSTASSSSSNSTNGEQEGSGKKGGAGAKESIDVDSALKHYLESDANEKHQKHLEKNAPIETPYVANLNYTLSANGTATPIAEGNSSSTTTNQTASVMLQLSIWKSTEGAVSFDVMSGSVNIGSNATQIHSGAAIYLVHSLKLIVNAFIVKPSSNGQGQDVMRLLLKAEVPSEQSNATLPAVKSDTPLMLNIESPQSKLAPQYFLVMQGQIARA